VSHCFSLMHTAAVADLSMRLIDVCVLQVVFEWVLDFIDYLGNGISGL
jgi:hypothetical protein